MNHELGISVFIPFYWNLLTFLYKVVCIISLFFAKKGIIGLELSSLVNESGLIKGIEHENPVADHRHGC